MCVKRGVCGERLQREEKQDCKRGERKERREKGEEKL